MRTIHRYILPGLLTALLAAAALAGLPSQSQAEKDTRAALSSKKTWERVELTGQWSLERENVLPTEPADTAKHPFECETAKASDGTWESYKGSVIYHRSGADSWVFDRLFMWEGSARVHGAARPEEQVLLEAVKESLRTSSGRLWLTLQPKYVSHVYSVAMAEEDRLVQVTSDTVSFVVELEFDLARDTQIERRAGQYTIKARKTDGSWAVQNVHRVAEPRLISTTKLLKNRTELATLGSTSFDQIFGPEAPAYPVAPQAAHVPSAEEVKLALNRTITASRKHFDQALGEGMSERVIEFEGMETLIDTLKRYEPSTFGVRITVAYRWKDSLNNLIRSEQEYYVYVKHSANGYFVSGSKLQGGSKELERLDVPREEVAKMEPVAHKLFGNE